MTTMLQFQRKPNYMDLVNSKGWETQQNHLRTIISKPHYHGDLRHRLRVKDNKGYAPREVMLISNPSMPPHVSNDHVLTI